MEDGQTRQEMDETGRKGSVGYKQGHNRAERGWDVQQRMSEMGRKVLQWPANGQTTKKRARMGRKGSTWPGKWKWLGG